MIKYMYFYKDILSGEYEHFGNFVNDAVAERAFKQACDHEGVVAKDLELYKGIGYNSKNLNFVNIDSDSIVYNDINYVCAGKDFDNV